MNDRTPNPSKTKTAKGREFFQESDIPCAGRPSIDPVAVVGYDSALGPYPYLSCSDSLLALGIRNLAAVYERERFWGSTRLRRIFFFAFCGWKNGGADADY